MVRSLLAADNHKIVLFPYLFTLDVNTILTDVLLKATVQPVLLADKLAMEHMMIIALLHCHVGTEVGEYIGISILYL